MGAAAEQRGDHGFGAGAGGGAPPPEAPSRPPRGLRARWLAWRDKLLASRKFHRFAAAFPLTRPFARARARALFDLCAGFVYSQTLFACVRLQLFDLLAQGPLTAAETAARVNLDPAAAERLLRAAAGLDLLSERGQTETGETLYGLGGLGAALRGAPGVAEMVEHHALFYQDMTDPVGLLRGEVEPRLRRYWAYVDRPAALDPSQAATYSNLMAASQPFVAEETLDAYPIRRHRRLLDVGGGDGTFLLAAAERAPNLRLTLFDLPTVAERARNRFEALGLADRADAVGGSFFDDPLPKPGGEGADLITLIRVAYDHSDDAVMQILRRARAALAPGGKLLLSEPMAGLAAPEPVGDAYFGFYLLAMGGGRPRAPSELIEMIRAAGFAHAKLLPTRRPLLTRVIVAG